MFLRLVRKEKIILLRKHVTRSGFRLIGAKLIDGVGGQVNIRSHTRRQAVRVRKLHKELQHEGVCHLNVMLLWVCARILKQLKLNVTLYNSAHVGTFALKYK